MIKTSATKRLRHIRTHDEAYNEIHFPNGILWIQDYGHKVEDLNGKMRTYIIEVHKYKGFAMVKYYPHDKKKHPRRYELRGKAEIGYLLKPKSVYSLIYECTLIMRDFLEDNQDEFVGYIGQCDTKDNTRRREQTQRCAIYNIFTSSLFKDQNKYKISTKKKFKEINLRLIRIQKSKQEGKLTRKQMENYNCFLNAFSSNPKMHYELMTEVTRQRVLKEVSEREASTLPAA